MKNFFLNLRDFCYNYQLYHGPNKSSDGYLITFFGLFAFYYMGTLISILLLIEYFIFRIAYTLKPYPLLTYLFFFICMFVPIFFIYKYAVRKLDQYEIRPFEKKNYQKWGVMAVAVVVVGFGYMVLLLVNIGTLFEK